MLSPSLVQSFEPIEAFFEGMFRLDNIWISMHLCVFRRVDVFEGAGWPILCFLWQGGTIALLFVCLPTAIDMGVGRLESCSTLLIGGCYRESPRRVLTNPQPRAMAPQGTSNVRLSLLHQTVCRSVGESTLDTLAPCQTTIINSSLIVASLSVLSSESSQNASVPLSVTGEPSESRARKHGTRDEGRLSWATLVAIAFGTLEGEYLELQ